MKIKPGVRLLGIKPEMVVALIAAESIYRAAGYDMTVTSVIDGKHSRGSIHYAGGAADLRSADLKPEVARSIREQLAAALGGDFDVILEFDHIHVEYQPKEPY